MPTRNPRTRRPKANPWATGPPWAVTNGDPAQPGAQRHLALTGACWCRESFRAGDTPSNHHNAPGGQRTKSAPPSLRSRRCRGGPERPARIVHFAARHNVGRAVTDRWPTQQTTDRSDAAMGAIVAGTTGAQGG